MCDSVFVVRVGLDHYRSITKVLRPVSWGLFLKWVPVCMCLFFCVCLFVSLDVQTDPGQGKNNTGVESYTALCVVWSLRSLSCWLLLHYTLTCNLSTSVWLCTDKLTCTHNCIVSETCQNLLMFCCFTTLWTILVNQRISSDFSDIYLYFMALQVAIKLSENPALPY